MNEGLSFLTYREYRTVISLRARSLLLDTSITELMISPQNCSFAMLNFFQNFPCAYLAFSHLQAFTYAIPSARNTTPLLFMWPIPMSYLFFQAIFHEFLRLIKKLWLYPQSTCYPLFTQYCNGLFSVLPPECKL